MNNSLSFFEHLSALRLPTEEQSRAFADYVACGHSWYKHLPPFPPGSPFLFFLDPHAGYRHRRCDPVLPSIVIEEIHDCSACWHYSMMPTRMYRERFGHWRYLILDWDSPAKKPVIPSITAQDNSTHEIPDELIQICTCRLTALVHDEGAVVRKNATELRATLCTLLPLVPPNLPRPGTPEMQFYRYAVLLRYLLNLGARPSRGIVHDRLPQAATIRYLRRGEIERVPSWEALDRHSSTHRGCTREEHRFQNEQLLKTILRARNVYAHFCLQ